MSISHWALKYIVCNQKVKESLLLKKYKVYLEDKIIRYYKIRRYNFFNYKIPNIEIKIIFFMEYDFDGNFGHRYK